MDKERKSINDRSAKENIIEVLEQVNWRAMKGDSKVNWRHVETEQAGRWI